MLLPMLFFKKKTGIITIKRVTAKKEYLWIRKCCILVRLMEIEKLPMRQNGAEHSG